MTRSQLTAVLRISPSGRDKFAVYYADVFDALTFVGVCGAKHVHHYAELFRKNNGFDALKIRFTAPPGIWTGLPD